MAVAANFDCPERDKFQHCFSKLMGFSYKDEDSSKTDINLLLDQLNSLDYDSRIVNDQDGNELMVRLCTTIPLHEDRLVVKLSHVINNWRRKQMLVMTEPCIEIVTDYLIKGLLRCQSWATPDILRTLGAVLYENCHQVSKFHKDLLGNKGVLIQLINDCVIDMDILKESVMCMECLTIKSSTDYLPTEHIKTCYNMFCMLLHRVPTTKMDQYMQSKILISCLRGLQNILQVIRVLPHDNLGVLLAAIRAYMFYGLYSQPFEIPQRLYPSQLTKQEPPKLGKMCDSAVPEKENTEKGAPKKTKKKTKKKSDKHKEAQPLSDVEVAHSSDSILSQVVETTGQDPGMTSCSQPWPVASSSDSEWSDTEGGQLSRVRSSSTKVRQWALSCLYWIAKSTDKKLMFGYWASFIPQGQSSSVELSGGSLFTIVLKDPSPKCRMGALAALSALIDGTKIQLSAAEDNDGKQPSTFTPFSVVLGSTIKEIHRCLLLAMVSEEYPITLTQLIKCFSTVIANVPYHRMHPGLLGRIVKQIRHFISHRDPNVRVACLTCLGAMASINPPLMEVCHIIQPARPPVSTKQQTYTDAIDQVSLQGPGAQGNMAETGSRTNTNIYPSGGPPLSDSGGTTPNQATPSSGIQTPVFTDHMLQAHAREISWVVKLCVKNILPQSSEDPYVEPLPVRLESLQVLANLTKFYFPIIRNSVPLLQELIHRCCCDKDPVIKLLTAKLLDEYTQVLLQDLQNKQTNSTLTPDRLEKTQVLEFWLSLLNGPIQDILQNTSNGSVRATICDCLANIGDEILTEIPVDKRIMCLTVVLGLAGDEDRFIRASAIRTIGVYVLYKSLREDVSFVTDTTSAILESVQDKNISVRVKAAWSLANLCDALSLNREEGDLEFVNEFSDILLLNIMTMATKTCEDSDKVKSNGVRSLGNILRYISKRHLGKESFNQAISNGIKALMKNVNSGTMKVRWNACYAISNLYKNTDLNPGQAGWNVDVINSLCAVVKSCKNFKVRINAASALSTPRERSQYGDVDLFCQVWLGMTEAFSTAEDIADYIDFRYRDTLTDQICIAVFHLICLLSKEDLVKLAVFLQNHGDVLCGYMDKYFTNPTSAIKLSSELGSATTRLDEMSSEMLTEEQAYSVQTLSTLCKQLTLATDVTREKPMPKTAFKQTYD